jgi:hypothetical protein
MMFDFLCYRTVAVVINRPTYQVISKKQHGCHQKNFLNDVMTFGLVRRCSHDSCLYPSQNSDTRYLVPTKNKITAHDPFTSIEKKATSAYSLANETLVE